MKARNETVISGSSNTAQEMLLLLPIHRETVFFNSFIKRQCTNYKIHPFKAYSSVFFSVFTQLCNYQYSLSFRTFLSSQKETPYSKAVPVFSSHTPQR